VEAISIAKRTALESSKSLTGKAKNVIKLMLLFDNDRRQFQQNCLKDVDQFIDPLIEW
jgi:hypothetical protein